MLVCGKGTQGFVEQQVLPIGGTNSTLAHLHPYKGGGSNGLGNTTWFMTIAKIVRGSKTIFLRNVFFPSIDHRGWLLRFIISLLLSFSFILNKINVKVIHKFNDNKIK